MKKKLVWKLYSACVNHDKAKERKIYDKILKKSLKGKNTSPIL